MYFAQAILTEFHYLAAVEWPKGLPVPKFPGEIKILARGSEYEGKDNFYGLIELPAGMLRFSAVPKNAHGPSTALIAARTPAELDEYVAAVKKILPRAVEQKGRIPINFWSQGRHGNSAWPRDIDIPKWGEIEGNYPLATREAVAELVSSFAPASGKLVLWHGEPGTGKTWALRALIGEWSKWCRPQYIVDPEKLFGSDSSYLLQVLMEDPEEDDDGPKWRLLILEDTGELLSQDAKERSGQGLSRLLNVTDGLIGQGLKLLVLITTNEPLSKLHPAVSRPGRTAAEIEFGSFTSHEAEEWLAAHGIKNGPSLTGSHTLAELYAKISGRRVRRRTLQKVGF